MIVSGQGAPSVDSLIKVTVGTPQLSASSSTTFTSTAGITPPGTVVVAGSVAVGSIVSSTMIVCDTVALFPQASVYDQVRVIVSGQLAPSETSTPTAAPFASQLSV